MDNPLWPGTTVNLTCDDPWQKLSVLATGDPQDIFEGGIRAQGITLSIGTYAAEVAYGEQTPTVTGHTMQPGDSMSWASRAAIRRLWIRNSAAGSDAIAILTPLFAS